MHLDNIYMSCGWERIEHVEAADLSLKLENLAKVYTYSERIDHA